jgi:hypothetical protein
VGSRFPKASSAAIGETDCVGVFDPRKLRSNSAKAELRHLRQTGGHGPFEIKPKQGAKEMSDELETIESVNILRAVPHASRLPGVPEGMYTLRHELVGTVDREALTRLMRETGWSADAVRNGFDFHDALARKMYESVLAGYAVEDGWTRWAVGLSGTVSAERLGHYAHEDEVKIGVNMNPAGEGQKLMTQARVLVHDAVASNAPSLRVVADALSGVQDTLFTGKMAELRGDNLTIAGPAASASAVGVFFTPEAGGQAVHIPGADCKPNEPSVVRFVVPASLAAGQYRVSLASQWGGRKDKFTTEVRTGVYDHIVTVSA